MCAQDLITRIDAKFERATHLDGETAAASHPGGSPTVGKGKGIGKGLEDEALEREDNSPTVSGGKGKGVEREDDSPTVSGGKGKGVDNGVVKGGRQKKVNGGGKGLEREALQPEDNSPTVSMGKGPNPRSPYPYTSPCEHTGKGNTPDVDCARRTPWTATTTLPRWPERTRGRRRRRTRTLLRCRRKR